MILTQEKEDRIYNALVIGLALDDAYIYAGLTAQEIELIAEDPEHQIKYKKLIKEQEYKLLNRMNDISQKQAKLGRESATTWMLEHMFPRYSGKPMSDMPDIHLHIDGADPADYDTVTINNAPQATTAKAPTGAGAIATEVGDGC